MKKILFLAIVFFTISLSAQSDIKITTKNCIPKKGFHLKLKSVSDSRCPEGVTCIWAGEVAVVVEVYNNRQFVEENLITFNAKNREANIAWFSKYYPGVKNVDVLPYPKEGVVVKLKKQYLRLSF